MILAGIFFALAASVVWMQKVVTRYMQLSQLRELTGEYIVQDLARTDGYEDDLEMQPPPSQQRFEEGPSLYPRSFEDEEERVPASPIISVDPGRPPMGSADRDRLERSQSLQQSLLMDLRAVYGENAAIAA